MPLYTYECENPRCTGREESLESYPPPESLPCAICGGKAVRQFPVPRLVTDTSFAAGQGTLLDQFEGDEQECARVVKAAKKQGYTPGYNDIYVPTVADSTGDPATFVPADRARGAIKDVCRRKGKSCNGRVEYKAPERPPVKKKKLSEKFIRERSQALIRQRPELARKPAGELRQQLIDTHALNKG